jgi:hypothetical protein
VARIPFWINDPVVRGWIEAGWSSQLTASQLRHPWQQVLVDGSPLPGFCNLRSIKRKLKVQQNKSSGNDGGSATIQGLLNPEFSLTQEIYTEKQYLAWLGFMQYIDIVGKPNKRERHLLQHPLAAICRVGACVFMSFELDAPEAGGPLRCKYELLGYGSLKPSGSVQPKVAPPNTISVAPVQSAVLTTPIVVAPTVGR